jgi:hypothetical protein
MQGEFRPRHSSNSILSPTAEKLISRNMYAYLVDKFQENLPIIRSEHVVVQEETRSNKNGGTQIQLGHNFIASQLE